MLGHLAGDRCLIEVRTAEADRDGGQIRGDAFGERADERRVHPAAEEGGGTIEIAQARFDTLLQSCLQHIDGLFEAGGRWCGPHLRVDRFGVLATG